MIVTMDPSAGAMQHLPYKWADSNPSWNNGPWYILQYTDTWINVYIYIIYIAIKAEFLDFQSINIRKKDGSLNMDITKDQTPCHRWFSQMIPEGVEHCRKHGSAPENHHGNAENVLFEKDFCS